jgi:hypothetical protein
VTLDENFERMSISTYGGKDKRSFFVLTRDILSVRVRKLA